MSRHTAVPRPDSGNNRPLLLTLFAAALLLAGHRLFGNFARAQAAGSPDLILPSSFGNFACAEATVDEGHRSFGNFDPARRDRPPSHSEATPPVLLIGRGEFVLQFLAAPAGTSVIAVAGWDSS